MCYTERIMELQEFFKSRGMGAQARLVTAIGAWQTDVSAWANKKKPVPIKWVIPIERATDGLVTRKDLRPHDWERFWPELK